MRKEIELEGRKYILYSDGNIYSYSKNRLLKLSTDKDGYKYFSSKHHTYRIHRLITLYFIPNPCNKPQVNHKNGIKDDNRIENLEWVTCSENIIHSFKELGKKVPSGEQHYGYGKFGSKSKSSKKIIQKTLDNKIIKVWDSMSEASKELKINLSDISMCCHNIRVSKAGGYRWEFYDK